MIDKGAILFIEPANDASDVPVIDGLTRKMCAAFRASVQSDYAYGGMHWCFCDARSSCVDYILANGQLTNSLCIHYLAHHRDEVSAEQLELILRFTSGEAEPTEDELLGPLRVGAGVRRMVEMKIPPALLKMWTNWGLDLTALCKRLRGGFVGPPKLYTDARQEAEDLFAILCSIPFHLIPMLKKSVLTTHATMHAWGGKALRIPAWNREAWIAPFIEFMRVTADTNRSRRAIAMRFRDLGPKSAIAISDLLEIAKTADETHRYDIRLIFSYFREICGVPVPPEVKKFMSGK